MSATPSPRASMNGDDGRDSGHEHVVNGTSTTPNGGFSTPKDTSVHASPQLSGGTHNISEKSKAAPNPFQEATKYSHAAQIVPIYVLDKLCQSKCTGGADLEGQVPTTTGIVYGNDYQDQFVGSMKGNFHNLIKAFEQPKIYTSDKLKVDTSINENWNLSGAWGGEERLRHALVGSSSNESEGENFVKPTWWRRFLVGSSLKSEDTLKIRSRAGYWMSDEKRQDLLPSLKRIFLHNPLVPLILRVIIIFCSAISLGLAGSIFVLSKKKYDEKTLEQQPSTIMAIVVQCVAIAYLIYIAVDEYKGKPLGLRDPLSKSRLILLDLFFIIFSSANLSLAFNTLFDKEWVCEKEDNPQLEGLGLSYPTVGSVCRRQRALSSFLFVALCLWILTFTVSIVRIVHRVSTGPRQDLG